MSDNSDHAALYRSIVRYQNCSMTVTYDLTTEQPCCTGLLKRNKLKGVRLQFAAVQYDEMMFVGS